MGILDAICTTSEGRHELPCVVVGEILVVPLESAVIRRSPSARVNVRKLELSTPVVADCVNSNVGCPLGRLSENATSSVNTPGQENVIILLASLHDDN
ncbi:hypothetical protein SERLA73DRAFT_178020 [Serpula lacrymans var. lacrymans S7.3]|uniref:Uncharacterized protein n=1 Tax=Serpula lacrymans var. lacrymans (strain S7.3) TaxID=936435 RepID=F8PQ96_SERL3|nr:hypothetical protein SERLA73DRAFT_178020 [Serpula lacrymans var. lacrymans S7.3]